MSKAEQKHKEFWSEFEVYAKERNIDFDLSRRADPRKWHSYIILTPFNPSYFTVRGNSKGKNYIRCQIRFGLEQNYNRETNIAKEEELAFMKHLEKYQPEVESKLEGEAKPPLGGEVQWRYTRTLKDGTEEQIEPTIDSSYYMDNMFDEAERDKYFKWLAHNAELFLETFGGHYENFNPRKNKPTK